MTQVYTTKQIGVSTFSSEKMNRNAAEEFYPGQILRINSDGEFIKHDAAGGPVVPFIVAKEDSIQGNGVDVAYTAEEMAAAWVVKTGDLVNVRVKDGENILVGNKVESDGSGNIQNYVEDSFSGEEAVSVKPMNILGVAESACNMSDSSAADPTPPFAVIRAR